MKLIPNCSESVFRFHTVDPKEIQQILQALATEISTNTGYKPHKKQKVPLYEKAEMYDTKWNGEMCYHGSVQEKYTEESQANWKKRDDKIITQEKALEINREIEERKRAEIYPNSLLQCCAGLGDNDCIVSINKKKGYFDLNIGNNDISENTTNWTDIVQEICRCEEADGSTENSKKLQEKARDCTCGISYFE